MAGKRHHYLPQFLLSGFTHRSTGKDSYCWVFRKEQVGFETNIKNVGVEGYFYGKPELSNLDEHITREESEFAELVKLLRGSDTVPAHMSEQISRLVVHLALRTKHVRSSFSTGAESILANLAEVANDPTKLKQLYISILRKNPELVFEALNKKIEQNGLQDQFTPEIEAELRNLAQIYAPSIAEQSVSEPNVIAEFLRISQEDLPDALESGHIRALEKNISPQERIEILAHLSWGLMVFPKHSIILGDVGVWATRPEEDTPVPFTWSGSQVEMVVLPLSHSHVLIGQPLGQAASLESEHINIVSASLSLEYFASSRSNATREQLAHIIGSTALQEIEAGVKSATKEMHKEWFT